MMWAEAITELACEAGVVDCDFVTDDDLSCALNNNDYPAPQTQGTIMAVSTIFALFMAYGIGANDAANSWATCLGSGVSSTIQKGVSSVDNSDCWACGYCDS